ncbi:MAG: AraC family transcriptional regulator [Vicinamibacteria bacterium]
MLIVNPRNGLSSDQHALLWGRARRYYVPSFPGPLSVKSVLCGSASWTTDEARHELGESSYLVVNDAHSYTIEIDAKEPVETFCVFFGRGFVEAAALSRTVSAEALLDHPHVISSAPLREVLQSRRGLVGAGLLRLQRLVGSRDTGEFHGAEDALVALALALADEQEGLNRARGRIEAVKASTRDEILRRLSVARDILESSLDETVRLPELARRSNLSPFHLHRHFRKAFGETPQAYRTRQRLERAAIALQAGEAPVTNIALDAGFSSLGSFSALFKRRFGRSPIQYRREKEQD